MKKVDKDKQVRAQKRREKNTKRRKDKRYSDVDFQTSVVEKETNWRVKIDQRLIGGFKLELDTFLNVNGYQAPVQVGSHRIAIPKDFRLEHNQSEVFRKIKETRSTIMLMTGKEITIDFAKCRDVDFASIFLLRTVLSEYLSALKKLDGKLHVLQTRPSIIIIESETEKVNMQLLACEIITSVKVKDSNLLPVSRFVFHKGSKSQRKYSENKKGTVATKMRRYINRCLKEYETMLTAEEESDLDGIISEVLNNAEDHSPFDTWYAFGNFFMTDEEQDCEFVGEVNLAFMNFGYSIYKGIIDTKDQNVDQFTDLNRMINAVKTKDKRNRFTKENLLTLYSLQEGISRLKHEDVSRGTGTMTFIRSFLEMGDYESKKDGFIPRLLIFSGNTVVRCDNSYRPFRKNNRYWISLNNSDNLADLPDKSHLKSSNQNFPGTLLVVKMYLNREHLHTKIDNEA